MTDELRDLCLHSRYARSERIRNLIDPFKFWRLIPNITNLLTLSTMHEIYITQIYIVSIS